LRFCSTSVSSSLRAYEAPRFREFANNLTLEPNAVFVEAQGPTANKHIFYPKTDRFEWLSRYLGGKMIDSKREGTKGKVIEVL